MSLGDTLKGADRARHTFGIQPLKAIGINTPAPVDLPGDVKEFFETPDVPKPTPLPTPPTLATGTIINGGQTSGFSSLINTGARGLTRKGRTRRAGLIGG